jgi:hypothetical protein
MAPCKWICVTGIVTVGIVAIVVLTTGETGNADMESVDREAIEKSTAKILRIKQGGVLNLTGIEVNTGGGVLDWHIGTFVSTSILLFMVIIGVWWIRRRCGRHNHLPQDIEMQQVPDHPQEHQGLHQGQQEMAIQQEQEQEGKQEAEQDYELQAMGDQGAQRECHPIMKALRTSMDD